MLNFFASWCIPCQQETPLLAKTAKAAKTNGSKVQFVGVDVADPKANAVAFVHQAGIIYPVGTDGNLNVAESLYGLNGQPEHLLHRLLRQGRRPGDRAGDRVRAAPVGCTGWPRSGRREPALRLSGQPPLTPSGR